MVRSIEGDGLAHEITDEHSVVAIHDRNRREDVVAAAGGANVDDICYRLAYISYVFGDIFEK